MAAVSRWRSGQRIVMPQISDSASLQPARTWWEQRRLRYNAALVGSVNGVDPSAHGGYWLEGGHGTGRAAIRPQFVTVMAGINDINQFIGNDSTSPMSDRSEKI